MRDAANDRNEDEHVDLSEPLLDAKQVGKLLGVPPSTIYEWVRTGQMPVLRLGPRAQRWTQGMLERWCETRLDRGRDGGRP